MHALARLGLWQGSTSGKARRSGKARPLARLGRSLTAGGKVTILDKRLTPARADLAAAHLKGKVEAARFVEAREMRVVASVAPLRRAPGDGAMLDTQALFGESVDVYEAAGEFAWGQLRNDRYVGYLPLASLGEPIGRPTHRSADAAQLRLPGPQHQIAPRASLEHGISRRDEGPRRRFPRDRRPALSLGSAFRDGRQRRARLRRDRRALSSARPISGAAAPASASIARASCSSRWARPAFPALATVTCRRAWASR